MDDTDIRRCPVHAEPDAEVLWAWPCPDDCEHFHAELELRIEDMKVYGNFTRIMVKNGVMFMQKFRNHKAVERPQPQRSYGRYKARLRRMHELYARRRR